MNNDFDHLKFKRERERADLFVSHISDQLLKTNCRFLKTYTQSGSYRDALILFCIEKNYEYSQEKGIFTIDKGE